MKIGRSALLVLAAFTLSTPLPAQEAQRPPMGPIQSEQFRTTYIRLGPGSEGLLYEPTAASPKARIALVSTHTNSNTFNEPLGREMASRGYRVLMVNYRGDTPIHEDYAPTISRGMTYLRSLPGVERVVLVGHSGGGHLTTFYQNVAEHGPAACQGPEKVYPCRAAGLAGLEKADAFVLLDPTLGAFHQMSATDPAVDGDGRNPALDMFAPANGYDAAAKRATYSPEFAKRFYLAQSARNAQIVDGALERLKLLSQGKGAFSDDEPLVIRGMGVNANGARLYQPDPTFASHTKKPQLLLRADGKDEEGIVRSVRPPSGQQGAEGLNALNVMTQNTTVRRFLAASAIRTTPDYAITADDIVGVDWASAYTSTPSNARGVSVPTLVLTMGCHYLIVPGEIIFNNLGSKDKSYATVEGAAHVFTPCRPEYGNTVKRTFDFVDAWVAKPGRL